MSSSDWLQIVLSLASFMVGAILSWVFFRAQQTTDFNALRDVVNKVGHESGNWNRAVLSKLTSLDSTISKHDETIKHFAETVGGLDAVTNVTKRIETKQELDAIRATMANIDNNLTRAVTAITSEVKEQQRELSQTLQKKFDEQWKTALPLIESSFRKELKEYVPVSKEQDTLLSKMLGLVEQAINKTGEYQRINFEQSLSSALSEIETNVKGIVGSVTDEVQGLENRLGELVLALPSPAIPPESDRSLIPYPNQNPEE